MTQPKESGNELIALILWAPFLLTILLGAPILFLLSLIGL